MPVTYFHQSDEDQFVAPPSVQFDDGGHWWAGMQACGATLALAATLAASAFSAQVAQAVQLSQQDDPAATLSGQPDEDFWQNPVAPVKASNFVSLPLGDLEELPAGSLHGPAEEDFWINPVAPVPGKFSPLYLPDPEEMPASSLHGQPDEDYWQNPVRPSPFSLSWPQPFLFDVQESAGSLFGPEEEYAIPTQTWTQPRAPVVFSDDDVAVQQPAAPLVSEEDSFVAKPWSISSPGQAFMDDDVIAPQAAPFAPDEDYWQFFPTQRPSTPTSILGDDDRVAPTAALVEDVWQLPVLWAVPHLPTVFSAGDEIFIPVPLAPDEDYWQNMVRPNLWPCFAHVFSDDDQVEKIPIVPVISFQSITVVYDANVGAIGSGQDLQFTASAISASSGEDQSVQDAVANQVKANPNISTGGVNTGLE